MNELLEIEQAAMQITKETTDILDRNYPMDSRDFLQGEEALIVRKNDQRIKELANKYRNIYMALSFEEQRKIDYKNLEGIYYQSTHKSKGLKSVSQFSDEYDLTEAFSIATTFGMGAIEGIVLAEEKNDKEKLNKHKRVLDACKRVLSVHFWGESCLEKLDRYDSRLRSGRTVEEDIADYGELVQETRELAYEYAKARLESASEEILKAYYDKFENIFEREKRLTEFMPRDVLRDFYVNLHWLKVDAERTPQKVVDEHNQGFGFR